jgi:hypothetical protein
MLLRKKLLLKKLVNSVCNLSIIGLGVLYFQSTIYTLKKSFFTSILFKQFNLVIVYFIGNERYDDEQPIYLPPELASQGPRNLKTKYYCYLIELNQKFDYGVPVHDIVLVMRTELESDVLSSMGFELEAERGLLAVSLRYIGDIYLDQVPVCHLVFFFSCHVCNM